MSRRPAPNPSSAPLRLFVADPESGPAPPPPRAPSAPSALPTGVRAAARPRWQRDAGKLWWGGVLVRRVRFDAANLVPILDAFEARGWPPFVPDPLPRRPVGAKVRLREAVRALNEGMRPGTIHFLSGGPRRGVLWEPVE